MKQFVDDIKESAGAFGHRTAQNKDGEEEEEEILNFILPQKYTFTIDD